jgi:hypothetical protein
MSLSNPQSTFPSAREYQLLIALFRSPILGQKYIMLKPSRQQYIPSDKSANEATKPTLA